VIVKENPLANFKVLYGAGALKLDDTTGKAVRVGGVRFTIHDGIVYDAPALLGDVKRMVAAAKRGRRRPRNRPRSCLPHALAAGLYCK
jgi:hypothetical protein